MKSDLAIDDDANYLLLIQHARSSGGITSLLHCATRGDKAIAYLKGEGEYPTGAVSQSLG